MPASLLNYGTVVGQFLVSASDGTDPDTLPDQVAASGTVTFVSSAGVLLDYGNNNAVIPTDIECTLDAEGFLCGPSGTRGVQLIATDNPETRPVGWTWLAIYDLKDASGKPLRTLTTEPFVLPSGTTVDLIQAMPIQESKGVLLAKGDKGDIGASNSLSIASVTVGEPNVTVSGQAPSQQLSITLPVSELTIGSVTTGPATNIHTTDDESIAGEKTFTSPQTRFTGRVGVGTEVYGPDRLGDSAFQTPVADMNALNIVDDNQNVLASLFATSGDGYTITTYKSFFQKDHVFRVMGKARNLATEDGAAVLSLINEDATEQNVEGLDLFAQRFVSSGTAVAQTAGMVMLQEGTGQKLDFGFWYKTPGSQTYTRVYNIDKDTYSVTFDQPVTVPTATEPTEAVNKAQVEAIVDANLPVRGSRWYVSGTPYATYSQVVGMIEGDIFLYPATRDMFVFNEGEWAYAGVLAA